MDTLVVNHPHAAETTARICLPDLMDTLGFTHHGNLKSRFETFVGKLSVEKKRFLQSYTYVNPKTFVVADTYAMDMQTAMAFAMWINPDKGCDFIQAVVNAQPEPAPIPYFHAKTCNKRIDTPVAKVYT